MVSQVDRSEITPEHIYLNRRRFMAGAGTLLIGSALAACGRQPSATPTEETTEPAATGEAPAATDTAAGPTTTPFAGASTDERGDELTPFESIINYINYYEFTLSKQGVAELAKDFQVSPWQVKVGGLVDNPRSFGLDELIALGQEERIYRMRCVEAWSMVIPWIGFPLARLLDIVKPNPEARFVRFETVYAPSQMPLQRRGGGFDWPYIEGLRLDEAMHDLTILATGLYGKALTKQNGAPVRLVVPWKYGFKSIKSVVKIDLVAEMPVSFWMASSPNEYGFYANVNPDVPHPRWSQATERRIGELGRRETLLFNGYEEVASLYEGMDLQQWF